MDYRMHEGRLLPPGWVKCQSSTYAPHIYFFDTQTNTSRWDPPSPLTRSPSASPPSAKRHRPSSDNDEVARDDEGRRLKIAVIVPYRDLEPAQQRARHLQQFVPHMKAFMSRLGVAFRLYVVEQSADGRKFNRGKLLNIGFDLARREGHDVFIFHDVDLLPSHELGRWYCTRPAQPVHIAKVWKQYSNNPKYFGGVVSFNQEDFEAINGFPNTFWGWGGEDDEMYSRMMQVGLRPEKADAGEFTDLEGLGLQGKLDLLRKNEQWKCQVKQEALKEHDQTWQTNGLASLDYAVLDRQPLAGEIEKVTVDVRWNNHWTDNITRWQDLPKQS